MNCPNCSQPVEKGSAFCRFCGHKLPAPPSPEEEKLLSQTNPRNNLEGVFENINSYLSRYGDSPSSDHVRLTRCALIMPVVAELMRIGDFNKFVWNNPADLAGVFRKGAPFLLANGLNTSPRTDDADTAQKIRDAFNWYRTLFSLGMQQLFEQADEESKALLAERNAGDQSNLMSLDAAYDEAEKHYAAYKDRNYDAALEGALKLRKLYPDNAYFRNLVGSIYSQTDRHEEALGEFIYGIYLDPHYPSVIANLIRELTGYSMYPVAIEVARHYSHVPEIANHEVVKLLSGFSEICAGILHSASYPAEVFSEDAHDAFESISAEPRSWLRDLTDSVTAPAGDFSANARLFISYRRSGSLETARHLEEHLESTWPGVKVFRDESDIKGSRKWLDSIRDELKRSDAVLVLMHAGWADERIQRHSDVLRREVAMALREHVIVLPILVDNARMPSRDQLPEELRPLTRLHARRLRKDAFERDLALIRNDLGLALQAKAREDDEVTATLEDLEARLQRGEDIDLKLSPDAQETIQKAIPETAPPGQGIHGVSFQGVWVIRAKFPQGLYEMRITTLDKTRFSGTARQDHQPQVVLSGNWLPVLDFEQELFLGLHLDGISNDTDRFQMRIPMHQKVGDFLVGTDAKGVTWTSRNVEPREGGF